MTMEKPKRTKKSKGAPDISPEIVLPPLRNDDIPVRAGSRVDKTTTQLQKEVEPQDDIPARADKHADKGGE